MFESWFKRLQDTRSQHEVRFLDWQGEWHFSQAPLKYHFLVPEASSACVDGFGQEDHLRERREAIEHEQAEDISATATFHGGYIYSFSSSVSVQQTATMYLNCDLF